MCGSRVMEPSRAICALAALVGPRREMEVVVAYGLGDCNHMHIVGKVPASALQYHTDS